MGKINVLLPTYKVTSISRLRGNTCEVELEYYNPSNPSSESDEEEASRLQIPFNLSVNHIFSLTTGLCLTVGHVVRVSLVVDDAPVYDSDRNLEVHYQLIEYQELIPV